MGLNIRNRNSGSWANADTKTEASKPSKYDLAMEFFDGEEIRCISPRDRRTIEKLYSALKEDNYDTADDITVLIEMQIGVSPDCSMKTS